MENKVTERVERARQNFASGCNCAQAVVLAYDDIICEAMNIDRQALITLSAPFGGGMRMREVCGAVSGMALVAGALAPTFDPSDRNSKNANSTLVKELTNAFKAENGSVVCRELLLNGTKRPCSQLVEMAAEILARRM